MANTWVNFKSTFSSFNVLKKTTDLKAKIITLFYAEFKTYKEIKSMTTEDSDS